MTEFAFNPIDTDAFNSWLEIEKERIFRAVKLAYELACLDAVNKARSVDTYKDRTNNLRSSIGYVLYFNGECISENFQSSGRGTGGGGDVSFKTKGGSDVSFTAKATDNSGSDGIKTGSEFAHFIAQRHKTDGFVAIVVSGMQYSLYVESHGLDVLTSATLDITRVLQIKFDEVNKEHKTDLRA